MGNYCVYAHINKINQKIYIGITSNLKNRWRVNAYDKKQVIYAAFQKYGWDNFDHIVLINNLSKEVAQECEKYLIKKYNSMNKEFGYNRSPGGELISNLKGGDALNAKITYQYDLDGNFIKKWDCARDAEKALGLPNITVCCRGRYRRCGDWQWSYEFHDNIGKYIPPDPTKYNLKDYSRIYKYDTNGQLIEIINDVHEFSQDDRTRLSVLECCRNVRVSYNGYLWFFEEDASKENIDNAIKKYKESYLSVLQFSLDGKFIKKYNSAKEASEVFNCSKEAINHACSGITRKAMGYQWKYEKDCNGCNDIQPYKNPNCKEIAQFDLNGKFIQYWESTYKAKKYCGGADITNALHSKKTHMAYGSLWFFKDQIDTYKDTFNLTFDE